MSETSEDKLPGIYAIARELAEQGLDAEQIAEMLVGDPAYLADVKAIVRNTVNFTVMRSQTRVAEQEAFVQLKQGHMASTKAALIAHSFALPDGRMVPWLKASADDHELRANWQRNRAAAISRDAHIHEIAAQVIRETGVACLEEIESVQLTPELQAVIGGGQLNEAI